MVEPDEFAYTAHTTNLVALVLVGSDLPLRPHGRLSDIAPTMLELMHMEPNPA
jgi:Phosphoglyceromutase